MLMQCANCGERVSQHAVKCPHCGDREFAKTLVCSECENSVWAQDDYCEDCGAPQSFFVRREQKVEFAAFSFFKTSEAEAAQTGTHSFNENSSQNTALQQFKSDEITEPETPNGKPIGTTKALLLIFISVSMILAFVEIVSWFVTGSFLSDLKYFPFNSLLGSLGVAFFLRPGEDDDGNKYGWFESPDAEFFFKFGIPILLVMLSFMVKNWAERVGLWERWGF